MLVRNARTTVYAQPHTHLVVPQPADRLESGRLRVERTSRFKALLLLGACAIAVTYDVSADPMRLATHTCVLTTTESMCLPKATVTAKLNFFDEGETRSTKRPRIPGKRRFKSCNQIQEKRS